MRRFLIVLTLLGLTLNCLGGGDNIASALREPKLNNTDLALKCDRGISRQARQVLEKYVFPHVHGGPAHLPTSCPFHPSHDLFAEHEGHKHMKSRTQHQCKYCNKVFRNEGYLDKHMERKHIDKIPKEADTCLAGLCDVLHCEWFQALRLAGSKQQIRKTQQRLPCLPQAASKARQRCMDIADKCFPTQGHDGRKLSTANDYFAQHFCQAHTCNTEARQDLLEAAVARSKGRSGWIALIIVILVVLAMFYAMLFTYWKFSRPKQGKGKPGPQRRPVQQGRGYSSAPAYGNPGADASRGYTSNNYGYPPPPPPTAQQPQSQAVYTGTALYHHPGARSRSSVKAPGPGPSMGPGTPYGGGTAGSTGIAGPEVQAAGGSGGFGGAPMWGAPPPPPPAPGYAGGLAPPAPAAGRMPLPPMSIPLANLLPTKKKEHQI